MATQVVPPSRARSSTETESELIAWGMLHLSQSQAEGTLQATSGKRAAAVSVSPQSRCLLPNREASTRCRPHREVAARRRVAPSGINDSIAALCAALRFFACPLDPGRKSRLSQGNPFAWQGPTITRQSVPSEQAFQPAAAREAPAAAKSRPGAGVQHHHNHNDRHNTACGVHPPPTPRDT
jgi:hypothetical protein